MNIDPKIHLSMDCFWCEVVKGNLILKEHEAAKWLTREQLNSVEWLPADVTLIDKLDKEFFIADVRRKSETE